MLTADDKRVSPCCGFSVWGRACGSWTVWAGALSSATMVVTLPAQAVPFPQFLPPAELEEFGNSQYWLWGYLSSCVQGKTKCSHTQHSGKELPSGE